MVCGFSVFWVFFCVRVFVFSLPGQTDRKTDWVIDFKSLNQQHHLVVN